MNEEMRKAEDELADARLEYAIAESNLAAARAELNRAERRASDLWRKFTARPCAFSIGYSEK